MVAILSRSDVTGKILPSDWFTKCIGDNGNPGLQGPSVSLNCQRQGKCGYHGRQSNQSSNQNSLTHKDLWHWLVEHGLPQSEIDGQSTTATSSV